MRRIDLSQRWDLAAALIAHEEDAKDQKLPLMIWYGIEPLVAADKRRAIKLATKCEIPLIGQYIARRGVAK